MNGRLIINNVSELSDLDAINLVKLVVEQGLVSDEGRAYCYATLFQRYGQSFIVVCSKNKKSDSFSVRNYFRQLD